MTAEEHIKQELRRKLHKKEREKSINLKLIESGTTKYDRDSAAAAVRRNDKSIALLVAKLLCDHAVEKAGYGTFFTATCTKCRTSVRVQNR